MTTGRIPTKGASIGSCPGRDTTAASTMRSPGSQTSAFQSGHFLRSSCEFLANPPADNRENGGVLRVAALIEWPDAAFASRRRSGRRRCVTRLFSFLHCRVELHAAIKYSYAYCALFLPPDGSIDARRMQINGRGSFVARHRRA